MTPSTLKVQRWIDLLAALLARRSAVSFDELARHVPGYLADGSVSTGRPSATVKRMFERDKKELRDFGVPIETVGENGGAEVAYRISANDFYLPYLAIATPAGRRTPRTVDRYGYHSLTWLTFEPDELAAVADAARRVRDLGDPALRTDAESAMRKLAFDLPVDAAAIEGGATHILAPRGRAEPAVLALLRDALIRRKTVTFDYLSMGAGVASTRTVEPYGLFFLSAHWYLAGRDIEKDGLRSFRVNRVTNAKQCNSAGTPDFTIPATFHLRDYAQSRQPWELGDGDASEVVVEFTGKSGAAVAGAALGAAVPDAPNRRTFRVRRADAFVRWMLSFAGEARPIAPPALVDAFAKAIVETMAVYGDTTGADMEGARQ